MLLHDTILILLFLLGYLLHHVTLNNMFVACYFGDHEQVLSLAEKYNASIADKRGSDFLPIFYSGICKLIERVMIPTFQKLIL